ncbi:hypothetical protein [Nitrosovibrio tenuis]|uniref:Uncharacterized protein n=1 Tax=Nitrosovibrio tenuis TaxID=1233 RepID=A0A1H7LMP7_9PROT|nr:hypothetical protein [Nitrosovibrio tenuis]SEL00176.1 hypothetical protein SAMN05216387_104109 [Nitrosovibrio tenuis]
MTSKPDLPELAFYYPNPIWKRGDWVKNLILFFDGIALLVPEYMQDKLEHFDPAIVVGLEKHGLLHVIKAEEAVGKEATEQLGYILSDIIVSGALDSLAKDSTAFDALSRSRLGYYGDEKLADMIFGQLKKRGLARDTEDGRSIPMHPMVRSLILTLLSQILRQYGANRNVSLEPVTDRPLLIAALADMLSLPTAPSHGQVITFDLNTVMVDLGPVPIDEVLAFRRENSDAFTEYRRSVRRFAYELSRMSKEQKELAFEDRQAQLDKMASELKRRSRKAWRKPASFALAFTGAMWTAASGDLLGAALAGAGSILGLESPEAVNVGAFSYLFRAHEHYA